MCSPEGLQPEPECSRMGPQSESSQHSPSLFSYLVEKFGPSSSLKVTSMD